MIKNTYIYKLNFQCDAENIVEADKIFSEITKLKYQPYVKRSPLEGWISPLISVEIVRDPQTRQQDKSPEEGKSNV